MTRALAETMALDDLFEGIAPLPANDARVTDLSLDSREARIGSLFFALAGGRRHGLEFAADAVARGARVVLWDPAEPASATPAIGAPRVGAPAFGAPAFGAAVFTAPVPGLKGLLGRIADRFFGSPSAELRVVGITGTNGKTTCAYLLAQCLQRLKIDAAYLGTIGGGRIGALSAATLTTPDVVSVHRRLAQFRSEGVRVVAMEVSSHALDQGRVDAVRFHTAAFTNLTRDHLDYHGTMQAYGAAKTRLFEWPGLAHRVIHIGDDFGRELARRPRDGALTAVWVGGQPGSLPADRTVHAVDLSLDLNGLSMQVHISADDGEDAAAAAAPATARAPAWRPATVHLATRLIGRFNAENAVVVLACLAALDVPFDEAAAALAGCTAPPGRLEMLTAPDAAGPVAVIDYAHTPDALAKALEACRAHCRGALWCVFGCGGDRDPGKRPLMGAIADRLADQIIITDDNPRTEDPAAITAAIVTGMGTRGARVIHDRSAAIGAALGEAASADMVLVAGKGHEEYQIYGSERRSFSDRLEVLRHWGAAA